MNISYVCRIPVDVGDDDADVDAGGDNADCDASGDDDAGEDDIDVGSANGDDDDVDVGVDNVDDVEQLTRGSLAGASSGV